MNTSPSSVATSALLPALAQVRRHAVADYSDYKLGFTSDIGVASLWVALFGTDAHSAAYASPANGTFLGRRALVASLGKTF